MINSARATTREVRTLDTAARGRPQQATRGSATTGRAAASAVSASPTATPFQSSLWDAFSGTPARPAASAAASSTASATTAAARGSTPSSGGNLSALPLSRGSEASSRRATAGAAGTQSVAQNAETEAPAPTPDVLTQVRTALTKVGLNPDEYNLRLGSLTISYPNIPTFEYPVLFADINGKTAGFYLDGVARNPGMFAVNLSGQLGKPVMHMV